MPTDDRRQTLTAMRLTTVSQVADVLSADGPHLSRQRAHVITQKPDFPTPAGTVGGVPVWFGDEVEAFAATWERRAGRPPRARDVSPR